MTTSKKDRALHTFYASFAGRIDKLLGEQFPDASRKRLALLFAEKQVRVDGKLIKKGFLVSEGQEVSLDKEPLSDVDLYPQAQEGELVVLWEDEHFIALQKTPGMPTYPLRANERDTFANLVASQYPECVGVGNDPREAGFAHRLDADTSGVLLVARTQECWEALRTQFAAGNMQKTYLAVVEGLPIGTECEEELIQDGKRVRIDYAGLEAYTSWEVLSKTETFSLLACQAHTGRMHQVRAHLAHCGSPIAGDLLYKGQTYAGLHGHFLHASELRFEHPMTSVAMHIKAPLPQERLAWMQGQNLALPEQG